MSKKVEETSVRADAELHMYEVKMWVVKMKAKVLRYAQAIKTCQNQWNKSIWDGGEKAKYASQKKPAKTSEINLFCKFVPVSETFSSC